MKKQNQKKQTGNPGLKVKAKAKENLNAKKHIPVPEVPGEWLYFSRENVTVRKLYDLLRGAYEADIWEEAEILEISVGEGRVFDLEAAFIHPKDEATKDFAVKNDCERVFLVTFASEDYEQAEKIMKKILAGAGGIFCGDTDDFTPVITDGTLSSDE